MNLAAEIKDGEDDQDGHKLQADAPAHEGLRGVTAAAAQHVYEAEQKRDEDGADGDDDDKIAREMHPDSLRHLGRSQKSLSSKKNGRRETAGESGRIGQEAHRQGRPESPAMQSKAAALLRLDDTCGS